MNQSARFVRRNRVDERVAGGIAAVGAVLAVLSGAEPTASSVIDAVVIFLSVGAVIWAAASAPWWASAAAAGVGAVIAFDPIVAVVGAVGFAGAMLVGVRRRDLSELRSVVGAIAANVLIRSELGGFLGLSAIIGIVVCAALLVLGLRRRPSSTRRTGWVVLGAVGAFAAVALLLVGIVGLSARPDVSDAARSARQAVRVLNQGDYEQAATLFESSAAGFRGADNQLGGVLAVPARLIPGVAQNFAAGTDISGAAAEATAEAAGALRQIDPSTLRVVDGSLDLGAVRAVEAPLVRVQTALTGLRDVVDESDSPWIAGPIRDELDELQADFDDNEERLQNAIDAVRLAPNILGGEELRRYLLMFTSPAEARGLGGFVGSFMVLEVDDGDLRVVEFGRTRELSSPTAGADCSACDPEMLARYGRFGFTTGPGGTTGGVLFSNITMPAHFPYVAEAAASIYPQGAGAPVDGVLILDPYVVQALMRYSGPIEVPELDTVVSPNNAAQFLLSDQYVLAGDRAERVEALDTLGRGAIAGILSGALPAPPEVARDLGPLVSERRLLMWTDRVDEQDLLDRIGMLGSMPAIDPLDGGFSVSVTNASANKIDVFLERDVTVDVVVNADGTRRLVADVAFRNTAPASGLPPYVIGNRIDQPDGHSRLFVTFYGPPRLRVFELDGAPTGGETLPEAGWTATSQYLDLSAGESATYRLEYDLDSLPVPAESDGGIAALLPAEPVVWEQPLAQN